MTRTIAVAQETRAHQQRAADPKSSIWVAANAGSGKTHVLTERVLRLLLSGVPPESILCLTYTKAAAAEMRRRVSDALARWALLADDKLVQSLVALDGRPAGPDRLARARTLFASALETPGGLKIVTIHAFCESILHRFPLEARVPFDFAVIEEEDRADMVRAAREGVLAGGLKGDAALFEAVETLFAARSDFALKADIDCALAEGRKLMAVLADPAAAKRRLRKLVDAPKGETVASIEAEMVDATLLGPAEIARILEVCPPRGGRTFEDGLARLDTEAPTVEALLDTFLTKDRCVPKAFPKKDFRLADPELAALALAEAERLAALAARRTACALIERSDALLDVLAAISARFEAEKRRRSLLDFDDLIALVTRLLRNEALGPWVRYKLDAAITHVLVDESQDTNPEQWAVVRALADEFFVGESAVERPRTIFAVGDEKQSIYSFQGADPTLFGKTGSDFAARALIVDRAFTLVPLKTSFRTLQHILTAVDAVCARPDIAAALLAIEPIVHGTARSETGGTLTLWPPVRAEDGPGEGDGAWPLTSSDALKNAPRQVADRIAAEIGGWIASGRDLGPRGRPVVADDVLVLVQTRSALFFEIIRALHARGLPTPGADRLLVTSHIAVLDLAALGDVLLNPADDLQLAALLRSPLFDVSEDDLFVLCQGRPGTVWQALRTCALPSVREAGERLRRWRAELDFERPYEFFAHLLYAEGGLRRFHQRLGGEVDDVLSQFLGLALDHETGPQPSLQGFLATLRTREVSVKRDLAEAGAGVRVMTVHGAKGLESPIVILADAASRPQGSQLHKPVLVLTDPPGPLLVHAPRAADHTEATERLRKAAAARLEAEYWRKLYVGMTRAEDELYVTGVLTRFGKLENTWYEAIDTALRPQSRSVVENGAETALVYPADAVAPHRVGLAPKPAPAADPIRPLAPLPPPPRREPLLPSSAAGRRQRAAPPLETAPEGARDGETARREGLALHALLQHLGRLDPTLWPQVGGKALAVLLPETPERHEAVLGRALSILSRPELALLFGPASRAEVPFIANVVHDGVPKRLVGRIDRLVVEDARVLVVDYKSDQFPPATIDAVPSAYIAQLALYAAVATRLFPGRAVEAAILWTELESLMKLPQARLARGAGDFTIG